MISRLWACGPLIVDDVDCGTNNGRCGKKRRGLMADGVQTAVTEMKQFLGK
jgi:hypothetical protein